MKRFPIKPNVSSVVVIGGGVFGCAAAFQLAKHGIKTTLIERDSFGNHASGKNPGNLNPIYNSPPNLIPLALKSFKLHLELAEELADLDCADYEFQSVRRILLAFDESERGGLKSAEKAFDGMAGFATLWMDAETIARLEPRLSCSVRAGLLIEGNMSLNSRAFNHALSDGAAKLGVKLLHNQVIDLEKSDDLVVGVLTSDGVVACDAVVLATGPWVAETREWLGFDQPVSPVKGEMLRMRLPSPGLQYDFTRGMISLYRRGSDECWIGVTKEHAGFDETPTDAGKHHLLEAAAQIMPAVRQATLLEHAASLRPMSVSGLPVVGLVPGWKNAYVANGGGIKGMLLCTGIGLAIAEMILNGDTEMPINRIAP